MQQMGREHFSTNFTMWLQETLFPTLHTSSSRHAALLPYLPEDEFTKKLQSYTPEERSLFSEVMPVATYRPEISHRDAQLMRSSRDFILPSTHWMALPADFWHYADWNVGTSSNTSWTFFPTWIGDGELQFFAPGQLSTLLSLDSC